MGVAMSLAGVGRAYAQESTPGAGAVIVTVIPGGVTFLTQGKNTGAPSFANYGAGATVEVHFNRFLSAEGTVTDAIGVTQNLDFASGTVSRKTPNLLDYSGNLVVSFANGSGVVPYVTGGVGGLTMFDQSSVGIGNTTTFLSGNVGGGVKWFNSTARWGVRADYRFIAVRTNDNAPAFFGQETRYGHRLFGAILVNVGR
jgi:opacity protein-like surface antigen